MIRTIILTAAILLASGCVEEKSVQRTLAKVDGQVYYEVSQMPIPNATVEIICNSNGNREQARTDERGYFKAYVDCGSGKWITVRAEAAPGEICLKGECIGFKGGINEVQYNISEAGFAGVKIAL